MSAPDRDLNDRCDFVAKADLDVPGETQRQARVFAIWAICLLLAVIVGASVATLPSGAERSANGEEAVRARMRRAKVGILLGLALPALVTYAMSQRYRRGGPHARGITVDITDDGELRIWGRGYGSRLRLRGAVISERLVDIYAGRLGTWRERRLHLRAAARSGSQTVQFELAARATAEDEVGLPLVGGEGDCIELERADFDRLRTCVLKWSKSQDALTGPEKTS